MQIRKFQYIPNIYNTLKISHSQFWELSRYLPVNFEFFLKRMQLVNLCYCFCMFVNKYLFHISRVRITCTKCCYNAKPSACYFCLKRKISVDFQICISVPLSSWNSTNKSKFNVHLIRQIKANNEWKKRGKVF